MAKTRLAHLPLFHRVGEDEPHPEVFKFAGLPTPDIPSVYVEKGFGGGTITMPPSTNIVIALPPAQVRVGRKVSTRPRSEGEQPAEPAEPSPPSLPTPDVPSVIVERGRPTTDTEER
jgi:hypothetical protein